jgi:hypothetical protein
MADSHLPAVPVIVATIPIGDPPDNPHSGELAPPVTGVPPVAARMLETMAGSSPSVESGFRVSWSNIGGHVAL